MKHLALLVALLSLFTCGNAAEPFRLKDGDRVVLLGNTMIEREQRDGYWETLLTVLSPHKNITFRNLGWSGDNVFGEARAEFGTVADGFRELKDHVLALKPTVLIIGYGLNESFEGKDGLPRFIAGLNRLLDTLAPTKARVVLLSPLRHEDLGRPLPDPTRHNQDLRLYTEAIRGVAVKRGHAFVDFFDLVGDRAKTGRLTDNGIHLSPYGYWRTALTLEHALGLEPKEGRDPVVVRSVATIPTRFEATPAKLPVPPAPADAPAAARRDGPKIVLDITTLAPVRYTLKIDGKVVRTATARQWAAGVTLDQGPDIDQVERLRRAIIEKNRLYFNRWRPQNDTYLFGFRKYEQGQNAKEVPQFDPLVEKKEKEIARLRVPVAHRYEIVPAGR